MKLSNIVFRKFVEVISLKNWQVLSEYNTWNDIDSVNKTEKYKIYTLYFSDGKILKCADNHILIDYYGAEVFAKDSIYKKFITTENTIVSVEKIKISDKEVNMYDLSLSDNTNHLYYTNGILSHNSTTYCIYLLWYIIFNPEKKVLIAANKKATALEILGKIQLAYEMLPNWIKPGLLTFNKSEIILGNLSGIRAEATSSDAARGYSCNILVLDEFAFAEQPEKFWSSVYPIVSSDINGQVIIVSTPNGVGNLFHKLWEKANSNSTENSEGWVPFRVDWWEVPDRDEKWKQQQVSSLGSEEIFLQEFGNSFLSSSWKKLIPDEKITEIRQSLYSRGIIGKKKSVNEDEKSNYEYIEYYPFDPRCTYLACGDCGEGTGGDDSVLYIFDITYFNKIKLCAKFSNNRISTLEFAYIIYNVCKKYYNPWLAIERNTIGSALLEALCTTVYNYENVISLNKHNKPGIMSHMQIKQKACLWIRELFSIDDFTIEINDEKCIDEMDSFVKKDTAQHIVYAALAKHHDDHIMSLIWGMYILTSDILQKYYNVVDWNTTSIGKQIPNRIQPLYPYSIDKNTYELLIKSNKNNSNLLNIAIENERKSFTDPFFGDEEDKQHIDNLLNIFNHIKNVSDYSDRNDDELSDEANEILFYQNMIS